MKASSKAILWVFLVFLVGSVFGAVAITTFNRVRTTHDLSRDRQAEFPPPLPAPEKIVEAPRVTPPPPVRDDFIREWFRRMADYLELDAEQMDEFQRILRDSHRRFQAGNRELQQQINQNRRRFLAQQRRRTLRELRPILTEAQQKRLQDYFRNQRRTLRDRPLQDRPLRQSPRLRDY